MGSFKINLDTGNRFWTPKGLGALGMDPSRAIAELVANSLDWRREDKDNVQPIIDVYISKQYIEVRDNGVGMTSTDLQNAIQVSVANENTRPSLRVRKGMFGMGMKVACLTLGWKITIHTRSISEKNIENFLELDTRELDAEGVTNKYRKKISGRSSPFILDGPLNGWESGTSIRIDDLTYRSLTAVAVKDSLQEVFSPEISIESVVIRVFDVENGDEFVCQKVSTPVYPNSIVNLDSLNLFVNNEKGEPIKIRGWIGLMKTGASGSGKWGLHLFKNNQVIERFHQLPKRLGGLMPKNPHPKFARTYGEIHLDMCQPAFHKVGFDYSQPSWIAVANHLSSYIESIMDASSNFRVKDYDKFQESIKTIQKHKRAIKRTLSRKGQHARNSNIPKDAIILPNGLWFTIVEPIVDSLSSNEINNPWIYHYREESKELAIIINNASKTYQNLVNEQTHDSAIVILFCWAISDCVLQLLCDGFNYSLKEAVSIRNEQLAWLTSENGGSDE